LIEHEDPFNQGSFVLGTENPLTIKYQELSADGVKMAQNESGRRFLSYLISCALLSNQGAFAMVDGQRHDFPGGLGLAPHWLDRPLTEPEQRWVSAGILALTNFFGQHVEVSLRSSHGGFASLSATPEESETFTLYEGDFFGNVFADPPMACVAPARRPPEQDNDPIFAIRVGTQVDPKIAPILGRPVTRCGFILTGRAGEPKAHSFNGVRYDEVISVYLKPLKD
jgi:hypothetical protein